MDAFLKAAFAIPKTSQGWLIASTGIDHKMFTNAKSRSDCTVNFFVGEDLLTDVSRVSRYTQHEYFDSRKSILTTDFCKGHRC